MGHEIMPNEVREFHFWTWVRTLTKNKETKHYVHLKHRTQTEKLHQQSIVSAPGLVRQLRPQLGNRANVILTASERAQEWTLSNWWFEKQYVAGKATAKCVCIVCVKVACCYDWLTSLFVTVSIARRLQDPLAELIKIEPKNIGVGMYQVRLVIDALGTQLCVVR